MLKFVNDSFYNNRVLKDKNECYPYYTPGSLIIGLDLVKDDWFRGKTQDGQVGTFHAGYCWELDPTNYRKVKIR